MCIVTCLNLLLIPAAFLSHQLAGHGFADLTYDIGADLVVFACSVVTAPPWFFIRLYLWFHSVTELDAGARGDGGIARSISASRILIADIFLCITLALGTSGELFVVYHRYILGDTDPFAMQVHWFLWNPFVPFVFGILLLHILAVAIIAGTTRSRVKAWNRALLIDP